MISGTYSPIVFVNILILLLALDSSDENIM